MPEPSGERDVLNRTVFKRVVGGRPVMCVEFFRLDLVTSRRAYVYPEHHQDHFEVIVPREGRYECSINGEWIMARPGQVVFIQPADRHTDRIVLDQTYWAIGLTVVCEVDAPTNLMRAGFPAAAHVLPLNLDDLIEVLASEIKRGDPVAALRQDAVAFEIIMRLARTLAPEALATRWSGDGERERFCLTVERIFRERGPLGLTTKDLAEAMHLSTSVLKASFKKYMHTTPAKAWVKWRVDQARPLF